MRVRRRTIGECGRGTVDEGRLAAWAAGQCSGPLCCLGNRCFDRLSESASSQPVSFLLCLLGKARCSVPRGRCHASKRASSQQASADALPSHSTLAVLSRHNVPSTCRARKVVASDFKEFDWVSVCSIAPVSPGELSRFPRLLVPHRSSEWSEFLF